MLAECQSQKPNLQPLFDCQCADRHMWWWCWWGSCCIWLDFTHNTRLECSARALQALLVWCVVIMRAGEHAAQTLLLRLLCCACMQQVLKLESLVCSARTEGEVVQSCVREVCMYRGCVYFTSLQLILSADFMLSGWEWPAVLHLSRRLYSNWTDYVVTATADGAHACRHMLYTYIRYYCTTLFCTYDGDIYAVLGGPLLAAALCLTSQRLSPALVSFLERRPFVASTSSERVVYFLCGANLSGMRNPAGG